MKRLFMKILSFLYYFFYILSIALKTAVPKIIYRDRFVFLLLTPLHNNLGDHAIAKAENLFLENFYVEEIAGERLKKIIVYKKYRSILKMLFGKYPMLITGGGSIGTLWPYYDEIVMEIINHQHQNKIIIMPQTIYYDENDGEWLQTAIKIYNEHPNLTVCTREKISYELTKNFFENTYLIPDMVLSLNECKDDVFRRGVAICLRSDREKTITDGEYDSIINFSQSSFDKVIYVDMLTGLSISFSERDQKLNEQFDKFRGAELVITDRLHGMIFAAITGTPCAVLNSKSHKVKGVYDWCLSDLEYIRFVDSVEEISEFYNQIKGKTFVYDNTKLKPYYEKLLELIK